MVENIPAGGGAEEAEDLRRDTVGESVFTGVSEEDEGPGSESVLNEKEHEHEEEGGQNSLGVPEEGVAVVLQELELTLELEVTPRMEEKMEDFHWPVETEAASSQVRRRKKRRAKKASH